MHLIVPQCVQINLRPEELVRLLHSGCVTLVHGKTDPGRVCPPVDSAGTTLGTNA